MSVCGHDPNCSGAGWAHDAELTPEQRVAVGLPEGEFSMKQTKRIVRAYRKGFNAGVEFADQNLRQRLVDEIEVLEKIHEDADADE